MAKPIFVAMVPHLWEEEKLISNREVLTKKLKDDYHVIVVYNNCNEFKFECFGGVAAVQLTQEQHESFLKLIQDGTRGTQNNG